MADRFANAHELYGSDLLITWPEGQKAHENVMDLFYAGEYVRALEKLSRAITDVPQFSQAKEKDEAILLTTKAQWLSFMGDNQASDAAFLRAQSLVEPVLGTNHPVTARIQLVRAEVLLLRGKVPEAKVALGRAIAAQAGRYGTNDVVFAMNLRLQAMVHLSEGETVQARMLISQSSQIIEKVAGTQSSTYGANQWLEAQVAAVTGEYEKAIRLCESSLAVLTNYYGPEHLVLAHVRDTLANIYQQAGMYEKASPIFQSNLRTLEKTLGSDSAVGAITLNSLGGLHYRLGHYSEAEKFFRRCLSIREKSIGVDSPNYAATVNNLALVLDAAGKDDDASTLFKDAALVMNNLIGKNSPALATILLNWGNFSRRLGDMNLAKNLIENAVVIRDKAFGRNHPAFAEATEAYAQLQCDLGNFKNARRLALLALSIQTNFYVHDHPAIASALATLARTCADSDDNYEATRLYSESAAIWTRVFGPEHPSVGNELEAAGLALCRAGEFVDAIPPLLTALRLQRDYVAGQVTGAGAEEGLRLTGDTFYRTELFHSLGALTPSNAHDAFPAKAAEQLASRKALLEEVQATQASLESNARTSTRELCERFDAIQNQLIRLHESKLDPVRRDARRQQLQSSKSQIEEALAGQNGLVAQTIRERDFKLSDAAEGLPKNSVLLDFIQYQRFDFAAKTNQWKEQRYAAYLTFPLAKDSANLVVERVDLGEAALIDAAIENIFEMMSRKVAGLYVSASLAEAPKRLSQLVYAPLAPHLTNVSHLIVCPDGQLSRLPFEMLPVAPGGKYLIEEKTISYVGSGREIARLTEGASPKSKVEISKSLAMGNPDFDLDLGNARGPRSRELDARGKKFKPLPSAGKEAREVARLLGENCVLRLGADARETELKAVKSPRVLHLDTHGFSLDDQEFKRTYTVPNLMFASSFGRSFRREDDWENPLLRCGIALAGANHAFPIAHAPANDGILTGLEASLLNLQGTELVILSACQTGEGEVKTGEGVMSLRRAFRIAGAESVLASHWKVSDEATSRLMTEFMRRWRGGAPRAQAWREAQLSLLRDKSRSDFSNPYYWAAFTLTGQWR